MVKSARDFVADVGPEVAERSGGLLNLAACSTNNPERDCHRVLVGKFRMALQVKRTHLPDMPNIPVLKIQDMV